VSENGRLQDIGEGSPIAISASGDVILTQWIGDGDFDTRAILWRSGKRQDLGTLGGKHTQAVAINNRSQVIGWSRTKTSHHAFLWERGRMTDIGAAGGAASVSGALTINDRGQIVLWVYRWKPNPCPAGNQCHVVWENGKVTNLPNLPKAGIRTTPTLLTNTGRIYGWADPLQGDPHVVTWTKRR
jgi:probable HAF family extracellular repeat protein